MKKSAVIVAENDERLKTKRNPSARKFAKTPTLSQSVVSLIPPKLHPNPRSEWERVRTSSWRTHRTS